MYAALYFSPRRSHGIILLKTRYSQLFKHNNKVLCCLSKLLINQEVMNSSTSLIAKYWNRDLIHLSYWTCSIKTLSFWPVVQSQPILFYDQLNFTEKSSDNPQWYVCSYPNNLKAFGCFFFHLNRQNFSSLFELVGIKDSSSSTLAFLPFFISVLSFRQWSWQCNVSSIAPIFLWKLHWWSWM